MDSYYFFAGSQPFSFGSFLHSSAVGFLSWATAWNETAANMAARMTAMCLAVDRIHVHGRLASQQSRALLDVSGDRGVGQLVDEIRAPIPAVPRARRTCSGAPGRASDPPRAAPEAET